MKQKRKYQTPNKSRSLFLWKKKGQVVVEYILLLVVSVVIATILISFVDESKDGILFQKWRNLLTTIAEDIST
ncbi:MAG: hypothetical protein OXB86_03400 [Bdellovibrionales bacterium]|nr:hypothetical protein [Bdellovibrionales bacterium]